MDTPQPTPSTAYIKATLGAAFSAAIISAPIAYVTYWLITGMVESSAPEGAVVFWTTRGPFHGWLDSWLWAWLVVLAFRLPKNLYITHKRGGRPRPGGTMFRLGLEGDVEMLKTVRDWTAEHRELVRAAHAGGPRDRLFPACPRCGDTVNNYEYMPRGRTVMRFLPCRCRIVVHSQVSRGEYGTVSTSAYDHGRDQR